MKIGVVGYYGHGNFGDEWILASMRALAPQVEVEETLAIMSRYDMIISCKLHGIIAAALLRKRAKVLSRDNKFLSLCLAIPRISMDDFILQFVKDGWKLREIEKGDYLYVPEIIISQAESEFNQALASIFNRESSDKRQP